MYYRGVEVPTYNTSKYYVCYTSTPSRFDRNTGNLLTSSGGNLKLDGMVTLDESIISWDVPLE
jgi:hypothetical protein